MDKATVIGGSGFLGSHIADELSERGYAVTIFDHSASPWICDNQTMVVGDMLDRELLQKACEGSRYPALHTHRCRILCLQPVRHPTDAFPGATANPVAAIAAARRGAHSGRGGRIATAPGNGDRRRLRNHRRRDELLEPPQRGGGKRREWLGYQVRVSASPRRGS